MFPYRFRLMTDADLPTVERWLKGPEVVRWWGDPAEQLALLKEDLEESLMRQWVVERRERPFAYVQAYEAHAWPQFHLQHLPAGAQVIDAFVGEPDMLGHGYGSAFLRVLAGVLIREALLSLPSTPMSKISGCGAPSRARDSRRTLSCKRNRDR